MAAKFTEWYAKIIVNHPFILLVLALIFTGLGTQTLSGMENSNPSVDEILPAEFPVVDGMIKLSDNLGGGENTAFMVVVELDPEVGSEISDIRDPKIVRYTNLLSEQIEGLEDVTGSSGLGNNVYSMNGGIAVNNIDDVKDIVENNPGVFGRIVNDKYTLTIIRVNANEGFDVELLYNEVTKVIENTEMPVGVNVQLAGENIANKASEDLTGPDSSKTTMISLIAIVVILLVTFGSLVYGSLPLFTIVFGVLWTLTFIAVSGLKMSSFTAGAISMIIGIGIDFGIQTIMRFRHELAKAKPALAMQKTLENVLQPMFITTVAAFIGFWSMTLGDFTILGELGKMMAVGVVFCFLAAATVVPIISVLYEKYKPSVKFSSPFRIIVKFGLLLSGRKRF